MHYLRDKHVHTQTKKHRVITNKTYKMTEIDKKLVKNLPSGNQKKLRGNFGEVLTIFMGKYFVFG